MAARGRLMQVQLPLAGRKIRHGGTGLEREGCKSWKTSLVRRVGSDAEGAAPSLEGQPQAVILLCWRPHAGCLGLVSPSASEPRQEKQPTAPRIHFLFLFSIPCPLVICPLKKKKCFSTFLVNLLFRIRQHSGSTKLTSSFYRGRDLSTKSLCNYSIHWLLIKRTKLSFSNNRINDYLS